MQTNRIYEEPCLETLKKMPNCFLDCVITSPPYWQLRDYGYEGQWGLEQTFSKYLENLWCMMDEIYRVLKPTGTVWINLGDTYARGGRSKYAHSNESLRSKHEKLIEPNTKSDYQGLDKCLLLIPHRFAIGCIERGWILRNDIIWAKRNAMPESCIDRFSKKHEYFFFFVKYQKYFFDLDSVRDKHKSIGKGNPNNFSGDVDFLGQNEKGKNCGDVSDFWDIPTKPSISEHYAAYNDELLKKPILAGCPEFVCKKCGKPREKIFTYEEIIVEEKDWSDKYKGSGVNSAGGRSHYITEKLKNQPDKIKIANYLKSNKGNYTYSMLDELFGYKDTAAHWFRTDSGFSFPSPNDWRKLKEILQLDDTYDNIMTETIKIIVDDSGFKGKVSGLSDCGCNAGFDSGIVYDPFMGTGSTAEVALRSNRKFIGSEMSVDYINICNKRLATYLSQAKLF